MSAPILATKLHTPLPRTRGVPRPRLIERLNRGLHQDGGFRRRLTLISAPAGFGKTTLVAEWLAACQQATAWLSLDEADNDPTRFLTYLVAALQTVAPELGKGLLQTLQSPQSPSPESLLTTLLNEITSLPHDAVLVLDDYHLIDAVPVDNALTFLLDHRPPQLHLVIATREDPRLPLARLRARGQLLELRAANLRFTLSEATQFLNQAMDLSLSEEEVAALDKRTEGWIAGLQLAAISMQGHHDTASFIQSFTGSHRFVLDYLVEEVLHLQPQPIRTFLLRTSILDRLCPALCEAVVGDLEITDGRLTSNNQSPISNLQSLLDYLDQSNLFLIPLDNERRWYRYHHLFADLLRQRLQQRAARGEEPDIAELHKRASQWYEENDQQLEAFRHAAAANDIDRARQLMEGNGMPLHFRGAVTPVLNWLSSLPEAELNMRPSLWVMYASVLSMTGQLGEIEEKLQAAEAALQGVTEDNRSRNLIGHIAALRALVAATKYDVETIISQSRRALDYLHPDNLPVRTATTWKLGFAYQLQGERASAVEAYRQAIGTAEASGNTIIHVSALIGLGNVQESQNQLHLAAESYRRALHLAGDPPTATACEAHLGLARLHYQWNDLDGAQRHAEQSHRLAQRLDSDRFVATELFLACLKLARGDVDGATALLAQAGQAARRHQFVHRIPEIAAGQVLALIRQGNLAAAAQHAQSNDLPASQARIHLARGDGSAALALLQPLREKMDARGWHDEQLKLMVLQALAHQAQGQSEQAVQHLAEALTLAEPEGFVRLFVDEGRPMAQLLSHTAALGLIPAYAGKLLAALEAEQPAAVPAAAQPLVEPLSERELEVLALIAQGHSNREIGERLFIALNTVKGHTRKIYGKLQVNRRTEAVARARELGLL